MKIHSDNLKVTDSEGGRSHIKWQPFGERSAGSNYLRRRVAPPTSARPASNIAYVPGSGTAATGAV